MNTLFFDQFDLLAKPGVVGLFDHFELIEIVRYTNGSKEPTNILTVAVALENSQPETTRPLNSDRLRLNQLKGHNFGVFRTVLSTDALRNALTSYIQNGVWKPSSIPVLVGTLTPVSKQFVPPNSTIEVPLNAVLKNNFFSGSHVLELFDIQKAAHLDFEENPTALQELSQCITGLVPLQLASLSDRLGNIIVQFPIDAIAAEFRTNGQHYQVEVAWHPKIKPRDLIATAQTEYDKSVVSFGQAMLQSGVVALGSDPDHGTLNGFLWDKENDILLAATGEMAFIKTMSMNMVPGQPEPRTIPQLISDSKATQRVKLSSPPILSLIGNNPDTSITKPIRRRTYDDERSKLSQQRQFVQYAAKPRSGSSERKRALNDIRQLIASHGAHGVWIWDPYLAPQDLLDTLFHNPISSAPMQAMTALKSHHHNSPDDEATTLSDGTKIERLKKYQEQMNAMPGNRLGLSIEFRGAHGQHAWTFHDRFLIFPKSEHERAKAWSLGTSINSLGKSHHILQQADNAQMIADAFQLLWDAIDYPENLIWKCA